MLSDWPVYPPPAFFWWWFSFDAYAPEIFQTGAFIAVSGGFAAIVVAIAWWVGADAGWKKGRTKGWGTGETARKVGAAERKTEREHVETQVLKGILEGGFLLEKKKNKDDQTTRHT